MRTDFRVDLILISTGVIFLFGCNHVQSTQPQPLDIAQTNQDRPEMSPDNSPMHFSVLHKFHGGAEGSYPLASLVGDAAGSLYGTTAIGGSGCGTAGCGVAFKIAPSGRETVFHTFNDQDGVEPSAAFLQDSAGHFYGTAPYGGEFFGECSNGCGLVYEIDPGGNETVLYTFLGMADGNHPGNGQLIKDSAGNFYDTTPSGGTSNLGVVYKLDQNGNETVLHSFSGNDGKNPGWGVIQDGTGSLFGTTSAGGSKYHAGEVFKIDPSGNESILHYFNGLDGRSPNGVIRDSAGNFYGTTTSGGSSACSGGCGLVFKIDPSGHETVLHRFNGSDGQAPYDELVRGTGGNLYGTTWSGGSAGLGVVFRLDPSGHETVLHSFSGKDGKGPVGGLYRNAAGDLFGTTTTGGTSGCNGGCGVVFKLAH